ncbi:MAG: hypothetical protein ACRCYR_04430 [Phycicoccus sp.]
MEVVLAKKADVALLVHVPVVLDENGFGCLVMSLTVELRSKVNDVGE